MRLLKKSLLGIALIAFAALFFAGCPHHSTNLDDDSTGGEGGGDNGGGTTATSAFIKFKNLDLYPVEVYTASDRSGSPLASVPAQGESAAFAWNAGEAGFYLKYAVSVGGVSFPYIPSSAAGYLYARVDAGQTRTITIPTLIERLSSAELNQTFTSDVYVSIQNDSNVSLQFHQGSSILKPENSQYSTIMNGESAVYKISAGPVSNYAFKENGVTTVSFPAGLAAFEAGKMYRFVFNGSQITQNPAQPLSLSVAAGYEEKAIAAASPDVPVPSSLAAAALSESEILLTWNIEGSGNYTYYLFSAPSGEAYYKLTGISQETSFVSGGLDSRTTYYYVVRAFLNGKYSAYSSSASARTLLAAPRGVTAETLSLSSIKVSWNAVTEASSYEVERSGSEAGSYAQVTSASGTTYTDSGLNANAMYYYRVRASSGGENSAYSEAAFAATTDLQAPAGLAAAAVSSTKINLSWNAVSGAASYYVYRSETANGNYTSAGSASGTSYSNTGLQSGTAYYYKVRSYYNGAYSNYSSAVSATTPVDTPAGVTAQVISTSEIRLTWNAVTTGAERYYLYTAANSSGPWTELAYVSATSYTHSGLTSGTTYYYKVRAYKNGVYSEDSAWSPQFLPLRDCLCKTKVLFPALPRLSASPMRSRGSRPTRRQTAYTIVINADETLAPQTLNSTNLNNKSGVSITLWGYGSERTVQLASNGSLFGVGSSVTLTLDSSVTLVGRTSNTASLVTVNNGGTLVMNDGIKISGNTSTGSGHAG
ncbi:MAG: fibronectin type III domain-containing protein [Treponematales bacterium]